jgi:DNA-binding transcriptional ArsR family regulator
MVGRSGGPSATIRRRAAATRADLRGSVIEEGLGVLHMAKGSKPHEEIVTIMSALGDPTRMTIVERTISQDLVNEEVACWELDESLDLAKSTISYHTKILQAAGLIQTRREGRFFYYRPTPTLKKIMLMLETVGSWTTPVDEVAVRRLARK